MWLSRVCCEYHVTIMWWLCVFCESCDYNVMVTCMLWVSCDYRVIVSHCRATAQLPRCGGSLPHQPPLHDVQWRVEIRAENWLRYSRGRSAWITLVCVLSRSQSRDNDIQWSWDLVDSEIRPCPRFPSRGPTLFWKGGPLSPPPQKEGTLETGNEARVTPFIALECVVLM